MTEQEVYGVVYVIENKINGKKYVGQTTKGIEVRFRQHIYDSRRANSYLHKSINTHGETSFYIQEKDVAYSREELNQKECYWISKLDTMAPTGYNLTQGGENPPIKSGKENKNSRKIINIEHMDIFDTMEEACLKYNISKSLICNSCKNKGTAGGYNWAYYEDFVSGNYVSVEPTIKNREVINVSSGYIYKDINEASAKEKIPYASISSNVNEKTLSAYGHTFCYYDKYVKNSFEPKVNRRKIKVINVDEGKVYSSLADAAKEHGGTSSHISSCCRGVKPSAYGYKWMYYDDFLSGKIKDSKDRRSRKVICLSSGEVFKTCKEASEKSNLSPSSITRACKGQRKTAGGYRWQYYEDYLRGKETEKGKGEINELC